MSSPKLVHQKFHVGMNFCLIFALFVLVFGLTGCNPFSTNPGTSENRQSATLTTIIQPTEASMQTSLEIGSTMTREKDGMQMVYVPAGPFIRGSGHGYGYANEQPVYDVTLDAYWIDQTEVTNGQYEKCVADGACIRPFSMESKTRSSYYENASYAYYPVIYVDWYQAQAYCAWAGGRLLTEAEWEKAARGTDGRRFPWGNEDASSGLANYHENVGDTTEVGSYPEGSSPYGALDMAGNVNEWVADWYDEGYYDKSPSENVTGPASGDTRVMRGGSWRNFDDNLRASFRDWGNPYKAKNSLTGFRCSVSESQP